MTTKREQILAKIKTELTGTTGVGTRIYRNRVSALAKSETPSIVLEFITDDPTVRNGTIDILNWTLRIRVVVIVRHRTPDTKADATVQSLHSKIVADPTLGGVSIDVRPSTVTFEAVEADTPAGIVTCEYEIDYRSAYNNLT